MLHHVLVTPRQQRGGEEEVQQEEPLVAPQAMMRVVAQAVLLADLRERIVEVLLAAQRVVPLVAPLAMLQVALLAVQQADLRVGTLEDRQGVPLGVLRVMLQVALLVVQLVAQQAVLLAALPVEERSFLRMHRQACCLLLEQSGHHLPCERRSAIEGSLFNQLARRVLRKSHSWRRYKQV